LTIRTGLPIPMILTMPHKRRLVDHTSLHQSFVLAIGIQSVILNSLKCIETEKRLSEVFLCCCKNWVASVTFEHVHHWCDTLFLKFMFWCNPCLWHPFSVSGTAFFPLVDNCRLIFSLPTTANGVLEGV
jgi:hypothetical protein